MSNEPMKYLRNGCGLIAEERDRQTSELQWSAEHDDTYINDELRDAAIAYAIVCDPRADNPPACWPFADEPLDYSPYAAANLVKAGALIAAEIDRLRRQFQRKVNEISLRDFDFEVFDSMDAYDLESADWVGVHPEDFLRKHFAEDYDRIAYEADLARQSDEAAEAEVDDQNEEVDPGTGEVDPGTEEVANERSVSTQPPESDAEETPKE